jgi:hypothetical protein
MVQSPSVVLEARDVSAAPLAVDPPGVMTDQSPRMSRGRVRSDDVQDRLAVERWINEGGSDAARPPTGAAPSPANDRRSRRPAPVPTVGRRSARPRIVIVGSGAAAIETLVALHALAADRLDVTLLAPELTFVNRSKAATEPFAAPRPPSLRLADIARELGARWHQAAADRVEHRSHHVVTTDGDALAYDRLVLAVGARPARAWQSDDVRTFGGERDQLSSYPVVLYQLRQGQIKRVAFVKPAGVTWPSPLYELALETQLTPSSRMAALRRCKWTRSPR